MTRRLAPLALLLALVSCGASSPTGPGITGTWQGTAAFVVALPGESANLPFTLVLTQDNTGDVTGSWDYQNNTATGGTLNGNVEGTAFNGLLGYPITAICYPAAASFTATVNSSTSMSITVEGFAGAGVIGCNSSAFSATMTKQ